MTAHDEHDEPHDEGTGAEAPGDTANASAPGAPDEMEPERLSREEMKKVIESLIFVAERPITPVQIGRIVKMRMAEVKELVAEIIPEYTGKGIEIVEVAGGYQFRSVASSADWVRVLVAQRPQRLTRAQLETLALIAYRQPMTRPELEEVRGVDSGSALGVLLDRGLLKILGRKDEPGRPLLYGTTPQFLEFFGLAGLKDLPTLREFTDLSDESRALFQRRTGQSVDDLGEAEGEVQADAAQGTVVRLPDPDEGPDDDDIDVDAALRDAVAAGKRLAIDEDADEPETHAEAG
jgi:segregation and condensation protein B